MSIFVHAQAIRIVHAGPCSGGGSKNVKFCPRICWMASSLKYSFPFTEYDLGKIDLVVLNAFSSKFYFSFLIFIDYSSNKNRFGNTFINLYHGIRTPNEAFFHRNPKLFGLWQTIWAHKFWGNWGIFCWFISTQFLYCESLVHIFH